jgi:hypothetical protein
VRPLQSRPSIAGGITHRLPTCVARCAKPTFVCSSNSGNCRSDPYQVLLAAHRSHALASRHVSWQPRAGRPWQAPSVASQSAPIAAPSVASQSAPIAAPPVAPEEPRIAPKPADASPAHGIIAVNHTPASRVRAAQPGTQRVSLKSGSRSQAGTGRRAAARPLDPDQRKLDPDQRKRGVLDRLRLGWLRSVL